MASLAGRAGFAAGEAECVVAYDARLLRCSRGDLRVAVGAAGLKSRRECDLADDVLPCCSQSNLRVADDEADSSLGGIATSPMMC